MFKILIGIIIGVAFVSVSASTKIDVAVIVAVVLAVTVVFSLISMFAADSGRHKERVEYQPKPPQPGDWKKGAKLLAVFFGGAPLVCGFVVGIPFLVGAFQPQAGVPAFLVILLALVVFYASPLWGKMWDQIEAWIEA